MKKENSELVLNAILNAFELDTFSVHGRGILALKARCILLDETLMPFKATK